MVCEVEASEPMNVTPGVPQGTALGSLLLLSYMNDLPDLFSSSVRLFADDVLLYPRANDAKRRSGRKLGARVTNFVLAEFKVIARGI